VILFEFDFLQRALLAAALVGLIAPAIGVYLVQRRLSLMGDGIGHVAFIGVAAGILTGTSPVFAAVIAATLGAILLESLRARGRAAADVALALVFYGGIAGGILLAGLANAPANSLIAFLFGSPLTVKASELAVVALVTVGVVGLTALLRKELFAVCYDEEVARTSGVPVGAVNLLIAVTAAVTIAVTMRVVGILLVAAMLVLPVAAVQQLTRSFRATVTWSMALGVAISVGGLAFAVYADLAIAGDVWPSATIVIGALFVFAATTAVSSVRRA
jgi:zinc transport system permease protein